MTFLPFPALMKMSINFDYKPSPKYQKKSRYRELTERFEPVFLRYIEEGYSDSELYQAVEEVREYMVSGLAASKVESYARKSKNQQAIIALLRRVERFYDVKLTDTGSFLYDDIKNIAEESIYDAIGLGQGAGKKKKWNRAMGVSNFIKYVTSNIFIWNVLEYLREKEAVMDSKKTNHALILEESDEDLCSPAISDSLMLIKKSGAYEFIPPEALQKIIEYLDGDREETKEISVFLGMIYSGLQKGSGDF